MFHMIFDKCILGLGANEVRQMDGERGAENTIVLFYVVVFVEVGNTQQKHYIL